MSAFPSTIPTQSDRCASGVLPRNCTEADNAMAQCLKAEWALWGKIALNPAFPQLRVPVRYRDLPAHPFDVMPVDAVRVNAVPDPNNPTILSSLTAGRPTPILSYLVPPGYDGVVNSLMLKFVPQPGGGPGLQDGSGMLTWSIGINNYLAIGYSALTVQMGDIPTLGPTAHDGGIRFKSNDLLTVNVTASTAGIATLDPNGIILGVLQGWQYATR